MDKFSVYVPNILPREEGFVAGRSSCKGCGKALSLRLVSKAIGGGKDIFSRSEYELFCVENSFRGIENTAEPVPTPVNATNLATPPLIVLDRSILMEDFLVIDRIINSREKSLFICLDNEKYMNELIKKAGPKPFILKENEYPLSEQELSRQIIEKILPPSILDMGLSYFATACPSFPFDLMEKTKKAVSAKGSSFLLILTPCPTGWMFNSKHSLKLGFMAVKTGYFPLFEIIEGKTQINRLTEKRSGVEAFTGLQKRFFTFGPKYIGAMQKSADELKAILESRERQE